jgi:hypothetical protein
MRMCEDGVTEAAQFLRADGEEVRTDGEVAMPLVSQRIM